MKFPIQEIFKRLRILHINIATHIIVDDRLGLHLFHQLELGFKSLELLPIDNVY